MTWHPETSKAVPDVDYGKLRRLKWAFAVGAALFSLFGGISLEP